MQYLNFTATWVALIAFHALLSHAAMVSRGSPPLIAEYYTALFIAPLFVWLPAAFEDSKVRSMGVLIGGLGFAIIYALVKTNLESARPHIGFTHGVLGMIEVEWPRVAIQALVLYVPTTLSLYFLERVLGDIFGRLHTLQFIAQRPNPPSF